MTVPSAGSLPVTEEGEIAREAGTEATFIVTFRCTRKLAPDCVTTSTVIVTGPFGIAPATVKTTLLPSTA
ncbi:MAG: hypothetical protein DIJKHBIC_04800 [Thermoanaerobaculia bacterium]|nr:hypothetical protein [Thermoanaerobaculia bacterium]MCG3195517.1 hypothetical protein [Thermoanaerobaculia bacterium]